MHGCAVYQLWYGFGVCLSIGLPCVIVVRDLTPGAISNSVHLTDMTLSKVDVDVTRGKPNKITSLCSSCAYATLTSFWIDAPPHWIGAV